MNEGYIKFNCDWEKTSPIDPAHIKKLNRWRQRLYKMGLVGAYEDGVGFGNLSLRAERNNFYITGSKTGLLQELNEYHYCKVTDFDIEKNWVKCVGPVIASSESMSHAVIYNSIPAVNAVFHVHHLELWNKLLYHIPTTNVSAYYGSPEMAKEIIRLLEQTDVVEQKIFAMAGHREGLISFGNSTNEAGEVLLIMVN